MTELRSEVVAEADDRVDSSSEKAKRREARVMVGAYHQEQLRALLEHVREGFDQFDVGEIDEFELDDLVHRYKRAARQLWTSWPAPRPIGEHVSPSAVAARAGQAVRGQLTSAGER